VWSGDQLTVYEGHQNITGARAHLAKKFGVPRSNDVAGLLLGLDTPAPGLHAVPVFDDLVARY
jgi:hypothetical protein